ncbi:GIY-YIG nuclease family protein [Salipiger mucosus]|uniref:GIY-YIG nuclease family protein n=1 Tax=Salipiger mucosus TaxID=263378 RepID=UPI001FE18D67
MPGMVKIGCTTRTPRERARELSSTSGVPAPFEVSFCLKVADAYLVEKGVHAILAKHRFRRNREFFCVPNRLARDRIVRIAKRDQSNKIWPVLGILGLIVAKIALIAPLAVS